ncbi:GAF domain-containing protein [Calothrix sp. CCY 0018]|uniref:sensor histidine kinase n=1 Tax=Calothrix sp. CCY 0018 TaxID=3103864 RepID=UPI0039C718F1
MKKRITTSPQQRPDEQEDLEKYQFKLMQHPVTPAHRLVYEINQIIASSCTPPDRMLEEIARLVGSAFEVDYCCLVTSQDFGEVLSASWGAQKDYLGLSNHQHEAFSIEQLELPVVECAAEPFTIEDISTIQESLVIGCQNFPLPIKAVLAIPTRFGGENNGVISLIKCEPYEWSDTEKELLRTVESCCAIAFAQVAQAQTISLQKQQVRKSEQHQSLIQQLTILNRSNLEFNQMLQLVVSSTAEALGADRGLLILLKYSDPLFRIRAKTQIPKAKATVVSEWCREESGLCEQLQSLEQSYSLADCGISQRAFKASKPVAINDNSDRRKDTSTIAPVFVLDKLPAALLMPLESQGKVLGFLVLQQKQRRNWQQAELNIVEMVCAQISNAIIQTQTLKQVQTLVDERTAQLQRSLEVQAKLYERTRQYVEQLRELNELKDEFLSNMSDRLRYPLTNMRMAIRNLRQPQIDADRQARYLDILEQECTKEINLINDLLTLQKLETHQERPQFETIDLNTKIQDTAAAFDKKLAEKGLSIALLLPSEPLKLQTEVESFDRILQELLTNTCKYSERDSCVELLVSQICQTETKTDQLQIQVINVGRGISEEEATFIFDKFRRGKGRWTPGTGLGLALVKSLIQHLNGEISVESTSIEDSELSLIKFTLTFPQFSDDSEALETS